MDMLIACMSWVPCLLGSFTETRAVDLPDEIIVDIFSRLPAGLVFQCCHLSGNLRSLTSSQSFIDLHWKRANSVLVFPGEEHVNDHADKGEILLYFIGERGNKIVVRSMPISFVRMRYTPQYRLVGSYRGWLLFHSMFIFAAWNPATGEQHIVHNPVLCEALGVFFDHKTKVCKAVFLHGPKAGYELIIYSFGTTSFRKSAKFYHLIWPRPAVIVNSALHWLESGSSPPPGGATSIVLFDIETEEIRTMAKPGDRVPQIGYPFVHLLKMDELMCFCDTAISLDMDLWVLENYAQVVWVKRYKINICGLNAIFNVKLDKDELIYYWREAVCCYHLKLNSTRKLKLQGVKGKLELARFVHHTSSLFSLL